MNDKVNIYASADVQAVLVRNGLLETFQDNDIAVFLYNDKISFDIEKSIITCAARPLVVAISNQKEFDAINKIAEDKDTDLADLFIMWCGKENTPKQKQIPVLCVDQLLFHPKINEETFIDEAARARRVTNLKRIFN